MSLIVLILNSCQKEADSSDIQKSAITKVTKAPPSNLRVWHDNGNPNGQDGIDYGCWDQGGNCLPDVIITPKDQKTIQVLRDIYLLSLSGTQEQIVQVVKENLNVLSSLIDEKILDSVIKGEKQLTVKGNLDENNGAYIIVSENKEIIQVQPMKM